MKKVLFFMFLLFLMGLETASVSAQVRIGGNMKPNDAAVLDLNVDNSDVGNKGALALPRVSLASTTAQLNGTTPLVGMLVYNTNPTITKGRGVGIYMWDGTRWGRLVPASEEDDKPVVTWTLVKDTMLTFTVPSTGHANYVIPGLAQNDVCTGLGLYLVPWDNMIYLSYQSGFGPITRRLKCWRPSV